MKVRFLKETSISCGNKGCTHTWAIPVGTTGTIVEGILKDGTKVTDFGAYKDLSGFKGITIKTDVADSPKMHMCAECAIAKGMIEVIGD